MGSSLYRPLEHLESRQSPPKGLAESLLCRMSGNFIDRANLVPREPLHPQYKHVLRDGITPSKKFIDQNFVFELPRRVAPRWCCLVQSAGMDQYHLPATEAVT